MCYNRVKNNANVVVVITLFDVTVSDLRNNNITYAKKKNDYIRTYLLERQIHFGAYEDKVN